MKSGRIGFSISFTSTLFADLILTSGVELLNFFVDAAILAAFSALKK